MYALSNSLLEQVGEYRVEVYTMSILNHKANVEIHLKIFEAGGNTVYMADYEIFKSEDESKSGSILNYESKEETMLMVERVAVGALEDEDRIW
ncbi:hypothetical protein ACTHOQ_13835 [Solibacillus silvestris]|uniref:hypothetical protein n=1 Tax=Solibacillus silvestris TaxID=76853 RepID=UPI003F7F8CA3